MKRMEMERVMDKGMEMIGIQMVIMMTKELEIKTTVQVTMMMMNRMI
jgi:hypothetical protein